MDFGSLFSGIEGLGLGLERAGMRCRWQVEIDPYCQAVLRKHWPDVPKYGDIKGLMGDELERVDLICGGFPCQPVSLAGRRQGAADERWLWPEFARLLRVLRPRYALLENVPGLLVGGGMGEVLGDLATLGFDAEWDCVSACSVGAPHTRYRLFIVAYPHSRNGDQGMGAITDWKAAIFAEHHGARSSTYRADWMEGPPSDARMAHGLSGRLDWRKPNGRLGNAVVPQVAEAIGRMILAHEERASWR